MALPTTIRRRVIKVAGRLLALQEESVAPRNAVNLLVAEGILSPRAESDPALAWSSAIRSIVPESAASIAAYVRGSEQQQGGVEAMRFLSRLHAEPRKWNDSLAMVGTEFVVLLLVVTTYSLFVVPQFRAVFRASGAVLPQYTQMVFGLLSPGLPILWVAVLVGVIGLAWRFIPRMLGPLVRPLDRLLLALPGIGSSFRRTNAEMISGWLGFAAPDASSRQTAVEAAQAWYSGGLLSRICANVLTQAAFGRDISECLAQSSGFDREFRAVMSMSDRVEALAALRVRWRVEANPQPRDKLTAALIHIGLGFIVAAMVIAMYLPIFKLAALLG